MSISVNKISLSGQSNGRSGATSKLPIIPVQELPDPSEAKKAIYLVPAAEAEEGNLFDEYIVVDGKWEKIGSGKISLEDYYTKSEADGKFAGKGEYAKVVRFAKSDATFQEIYNAWQSGSHVIVYDENEYEYTLFHAAPRKFTFVSFHAYTAERVIYYNVITIDENDIWASIERTELALSNWIGNLYELTTEDKRNLVAAINEILAGLAGYVNQFAHELENKQSSIGDLDAIRTGAMLGASALQKPRADELYQPIGQYTTRTEVINLINEYLKWGDGLLTLTYNSEENQETILFNKSVLDNAEIIEIDGTEVDASAFTIRNISGPRLSSSDSITNEMANYRFAEAGEHIIRIKYTAKTLGSYSFWNSPKLVAIELPTRITTIDADAVMWLGNLASILLSDNITSISDRFCYHCPSLVSFAFPNKISVVSNAALTGCSALSTLILGKSMTAESITTGENVGAWSLGDLFGLTDIYIKGDNPTFTTSLSGGSTICFWNAGRDVPAGVKKSVYYEGNGSFPETLKTNTWLRGWDFYERGVKIN